MEWQAGRVRRGIARPGKAGQASVRHGSGLGRLPDTYTIRRSRRWYVADETLSTVAFLTGLMLMDIAFFLRRRTEFIRYFYSESVKSFLEIQHRIEHALPPFDDPPYSEDSEPPFLEEWMNAAAGIEIVGQSCVALLSDALKIYFNTLQHRTIGFPFANEVGGSSCATDSIPKGSFVSKYKEVLAEILDTDWKESGIDFGVIEQVVLARNITQHGKTLLSFHARHDPHTLRKYPNPVFATEWEVRAWQEAGAREDSFFAPSVSISRETLFSATEQAEKLADWIDGRMDKVSAWRMRTG